MPTATLLALGARLRHERQSQGLSLNEVDDLSGGYFKASCLGAYERGERVIPTDRLIELAAFYELPAWWLLFEMEQT